jgi:hypothetical protein
MFFSTIVLQTFLKNKWRHASKAIHEGVDEDQIEMPPKINKLSETPHLD